MRLILALIGAWIVCELFLGALVRLLRPSFPWLITPRDAAPPIAAEAVAGHADRSFDADLGWCPRPGQSGADVVDGATVAYHIDSRGRRLDPVWERTPPKIACFGDSFVFCRLVEDDETWPHHLSDLLGVHVANYGVGNYGLDQALLRFERELRGLEAEIVVMGVVPETIARVHSYWKHYFEYGNTLAFKPRFSLSGDGLLLHQCAVRHPEELTSYRERLSDIRRIDAFYQAKFLPDVLRFPYVPKVLHRRRHQVLLGRLLRGLLSRRREESFRRAFDVILRENARWTTRLYADESATTLLQRLIDRFAQSCRAVNKIPVLAVIPQPVDLDHNEVVCAYGPFFAKLRSTLAVVDLTEILSAAPRLEVYRQGRLGPHVSDHGNRLIAEELASVVRDLVGDASVPLTSE